MITPPRRDRPTIRCGTCPGAPILTTHNPAHKDYLCVRCQDNDGKGRAIDVPHPVDHLCEVCRLECPGCAAPTTDGQKCRACRRKCRTCSRELPDRPAPTPRVTPAAERRDRRRRWDRVFFDRPSLQEQCDTCRDATPSADPVSTVLAALPERLIRACGGRIPRLVVDTVRSELRTHPPLQLAARIERRWWTRWSRERLERKVDEDHAGWGPDDVALWLITPTTCAGRCEDGWHPAPPHHPEQDDIPCDTCKGGRLLGGYGGLSTDADDESAKGADRASTAADRSLTEAITYRATTRECTGRGGACGVPVAAPYDQCPECANWPWCACKRRRYNPDTATACQMCIAVGR